MAESITLEELLSEIRRTSNNFEDGKSLREIKEHIKLSDKTLLNMLRECMANGKVECGRAERQSIDGLMRKVPVYRIKKSK